MPYIIGTDEAGYGPNLGPLVIGGTKWKVPQLPCDLYELLADSVSNQGARNNENHFEDKIQIADSKQLYQSGGSIEAIERSVLSILTAVGDVTDDVFDLFASFGDCPSQDLLDYPTFCWRDIEIPRACARQTIIKLAERFGSVCQNRSLCCQRIKASLIFPDRFNNALKDYGNKATLLSSRTCELVRELLESIWHDHSKAVGSREILILCDKHGGRAHYAGLIQQCVTEEFVQVKRETRDCSIYCWNENGFSVEMRFQAKGERHLPIALASMIAKYLRELSMLAWNSFWCQRLPDLRPTAGYPVDAKRFKSEIANLQKEIGISDQLIWRSR